MRPIVLAAAVLALGASSSGTAATQTPAPGADPGNLTRFSRGVKARFDSIKRDIVEAAEAVPENEYGFKPTPQVRSFGELVGHVADAQNYFCGVAAGNNPRLFRRDREVEVADEGGARERAQGVGRRVR
jgi:hypothetical protein